MEIKTHGVAPELWERLIYQRTINTSGVSLIKRSHPFAVHERDLHGPQNLYIKHGCRE